MMVGSRSCVSPIVCSLLLSIVLTERSTRVWAGPKMSTPAACHHRYHQHLPMVRLRGGSGKVQPIMVETSIAATQELLLPHLPELLSKATQRAGPGAFLKHSRARICFNFSACEYMASLISV
jgi:hypothetical protein